MRAWRQNILIGIGCIAIVLGFVLNNWTLPTVLTSDGTIDSSVTKLMIWVADFALIIGGLLLIKYRQSARLHKGLLLGVWFVLLILLADFGLYWMSPVLPSNVVQGMSPQAQIRYTTVHSEAGPWVYRDEIRTFRPKTTFTYFDLPLQIDEYGYRNPPNYLQNDAPDILLLGDSFTMGTQPESIADYMREELSTQSVYSLGVMGEGIPHWRYQYHHFTDTMGHDFAPDIVVLNLFTGNDIDNTELFVGLEAADGKAESLEYFYYYNYPFLVPSASRSWNVPKLPELYFLLNYVSAPLNVQSRETMANGEQVVAGLLHEPHPDRINDVILEQIALTVQAIEAVQPNTMIVLSLIPAPAAFSEYNCAECALEREWQQTNADTLATLSQQLQIEFHDATPTLQAFAENESIWSGDMHFNQRGYELYAQSLTDFVQTINQVASD